MSKKQKKQKGITLIALVITIIILLILAGITINFIMNKGIIDMAKNAKEKYEQAAINEQRDLDELYGSLQIAAGDNGQITINKTELNTYINDQIAKQLYPNTQENITVFTDTTTEQTYTVTHSGWLYIAASRNASMNTIVFKRNDMEIFQFNGIGANYAGYNSTYVPVKQGDIITKIQNNTGFTSKVRLYYYQDQNIE